MRDYAELIKALRCCRLTSARGCAECPFSINSNEKCANLLPDAADAIEELLAAVSAQKETIGELRKRNDAQADVIDEEWTSVEERLPEKHKAVLFYIPWNKTNMIGWIDEGGDINLEGYGRCYDFSLIKPSHWMPIPEPPKEVE